MSASHGGKNSGLFAALINISVTLLESGKARLELIGNELEEEKLRAISLLFMAQGMVFCFGVGILLTVAFLTVMFWDNRMLVLCTAAGLFLILGGVFFALFKRFVHRPDKVFATSIAEFKEDLRQFKAIVSHESPAE